MKRAITISFISAFLLISCISLDTTTGTGVGVINVPPTFVSIEIDEIDDQYHIDTVISDNNGRGDIYALNVNIYDSNKELLSNFSYYQWDSTDRRTASRIDSFVDHQGGYLVRDESSFERYVGPDWFMENTTIRIRFVVEPLDGETIVITAQDMRLEEAVFEGPLTSQVSIPPFIRGRMIPLLTSALVAILGTGVVLLDRRNKNVLAMAVRQKMEEEIGDG